jgi:TonB family protein
MTTRRLTLALAVLLAASAGAQDSRTARLAWPNFRIILAPDSGGLYLWMTALQPVGAHKSYQSMYDPAAAIAWVTEARAFLDQKVADGDTAIAHRSAALPGLEDFGRTYVVRRREGPAWTTERFLVFEPKDPRVDPIFISADEPIVRTILDSIEVVSRRAPAFKPVVLRDSTGAQIKYDENARLYPGQRAPTYPPDERKRNREGIVAVRFVIGVDGKADMSTVNVLASSGDPFLGAVLEKLPELRFEPAKLHGVATRQLVIMPFDFSMVR